MMVKQYLYASRVVNILDFLGCPINPPTLRYLNQLIHAYIRKVPWESVSRIVKRRKTLETKDCPRWPEEFWEDAINLGLGGTCFESSLAFFTLLMTLGYEGYLTVNDMGESRGCHAAILLFLDGNKYLVDITIPLHAAVRIDERKITRRHTAFHNYTIRPVQNNKYEVERSHHPNRNAFTLIDRPVCIQEYQKIVEDDYSETGFFLDSVVIAKVMGNRTWRFFSEHKPYKLESFNRQSKSDILLSTERLAQTLSEKFAIPEDQIQAAMMSIQDSLDLGPDSQTN